MSKLIALITTVAALSLAGCGGDKEDVSRIDAPTAAQASTAITEYLTREKATLVQDVPLEQMGAEGNQAEYNACTSLEGAKVAKTFTVVKEANGIHVQQAAPAPEGSAVTKACA